MSNLEIASRSNGQAFYEDERWTMPWRSPSLIPEVRRLDCELRLGRVSWVVGPAATAVKTNASMDLPMLFSVSKSAGVRVLSTAHSDALGYVVSVLPDKLDEREQAILSKRLTRNLLDAHDSGERDPEALRSAALRGVLAPKPRR